MSISEPNPADPLPLIRWRQAPSAPVHPASGELHLWWIDRSRSPGPLADLLDADERARMVKMHYREDRAAFARVHGAVRSILARYLDTAAAELSFVRGALGRPSLAGQGIPIDFNLSHAGDRALLAVSGGTPVGIDLEPGIARSGMLQIARRIFPAPLHQALCALPEQEQPRAFLLHWTALEACAKAQGKGVFSDHTESLPRHSFQPDRGWRATVAMERGVPPAGTWRTYRFD